MHIDSEADIALDTGCDLVISNYSVSDEGVKYCKSCQKEYILNVSEMLAVLSIAKDKQLCMLCDMKCRECKKKPYHEDNSYKLCSDCNEKLSNDNFYVDEGDNVNKSFSVSGETMNSSTNELENYARDDHVEVAAIPDADPALAQLCDSISVNKTANAPTEIIDSPAMPELSKSSDSALVNNDLDYESRKCAVSRLKSIINSNTPFGLRNLGSDGSGGSTNGELTLKGCEIMVERLNLGPDDILVDIGCSSGYAVLVMAVLSGCKAIGIEVEQPRYDIALQVFFLIKVVFLFLSILL
jgi:hypothetical protein